jgi:hypothetical protein
MVMVRGCMLRSLAYNPEFFEQWWVHFDGDTEGVESMINDLHLWEVFALEDGKEYPELDSVALRVAQTWKLNAEQQFPDRIVTTGVTDEYGPTVFMTSTPRDEAGAPETLGG